MADRTLSTFIDGIATGILYSDLPHKKIYPALGVGSLYKNIYEASFVRSKARMKEGPTAVVQIDDSNLKAVRAT